MVNLLLNLRFRTRLALVMFIIMACTSAILIVSYVEQNRQIKSYMASRDTDLLTISQVAQTKIPTTATRDQALDAYKKALEAGGLSYTAVVASPTGEVVASTDPALLKKRIRIKKLRRVEKDDQIKISAYFRDPDAGTGIERNYSIQFPIVQGSNVIGYVELRGVGNELELLLKRSYIVRLGWILATMLAGLFAVVYLAFRFTKPVDTLVEGAHQIAQGNLYVSLPFSGADELARLAETFNRMVERLRENRALQERLNEAEKSSLLGRFAATIAHEVRNSLNFINLSIDQIRAKQSRTDERSAREFQRNLTNIKEEVSRLNRLVNEFLSAGRQAPPKLAACDVRALAESSLALVEKQAHNQSIAITTDFAGDLPAVQADAEQLKTCFLNVLTNAIQAMPRGGRIHITTRGIVGRGTPGAAPVAVEVRFVDTGPGIRPEDREKVFAPYFSTKTTGFGLGLAITKKIVEDHGGRIYVGDGQASGTVMVVEIPLPQAVGNPAVTAA
jgi:signal transduction histidine kinase